MEEPMTQLLIVNSKLYIGVGTVAAGAAMSYFHNKNLHSKVSRDGKLVVFHIYQVSSRSSQRVFRN